jgi:hypothetical protein
MTILIKTALSITLILMGYLHNPTDISENSFVQHLAVLYNQNRIDPFCENCVI